MSENEDKYRLVKNQIVEDLSNSVGMLKSDSDEIAVEIYEWLHEDEREEVKIVEPKGWLVTCSVEGEKLILKVVESTNIITGTSVVQPNAKAFVVTIPFE